MDDGFFFISAKDFVEHFQFLSVCVNYDEKKHRLETVTYEFDEYPNNSSQPAFFEFTLKEPIKCKREIFSLQAA
jgi:hypothetical protein